jgi:hypothetical protein
MPPRIPDDKREAILKDIQSDENLSTRRIGARHGVSDTTVRNIAKEAGLTDAFSRERTESATRARLADLKHRRSLLAEGLLDDAEALRERAWTEYVHLMAVGTKAEAVTVSLPPLGEVRNAYAALGIAVDKHAVLLKMDVENSSGPARSLLAGLGEALTAAAEALPDEPDAGDAAPQS